MGASRVMGDATAPHVLSGAVHHVFLYLLVSLDKVKLGQGNQLNLHHRIGHINSLSSSQSTFMSSSMAFVSPVPLVGTPTRTALTNVRRSRTPQPSCPRRRLRVRAMAPPPDERPEGSVISRALEISFRAVWIQLLARGVSAEYEAAIQEFVVACVAAYKAGYSITALKLELSANEIRGKYKGRETALSETEKDTRITWIALVYLTLAKYGFLSEKTPPPVPEDLKGSKLEELVPALMALVDGVCDAAERGYNLQTYKMEQSLKREVGGEQLSPAQASIRSQWSRMVFTTVAILPDNLKKK